MKFKNIYLFDSVNQRTAVYLVPDLPEIDCLHEDSELSRNKGEIINGILLGEKIQNLSIFRLGTIETDCTKLLTQWLAYSIPLCYTISNVD